VYGFESHIAGNKTRSVLIMLCFFAFVVLLGYMARFVLPELSDILLIGSIGLGMIGTAVSYWHADKIIANMVDARPANPNVYIEKYYIDTVEGLVLAAGLPAIPKAYVIESPALNAFATGRDPEHSLIGVTTGLLENLDRQELEGVIAHEMAHIYNRDTLLMMVAAILVGGIALFSHSVMRILYYGGGGGGRSRDRDSGGAGGILILIALVFIILAPIFSNLLNLFLSRKREFLADATAVSLARNPDGLVSALKKISAHHQPMPNVEKELSALFIENPHQAVDAEGGMAAWFSTHPPVAARIRALESM
jgi:heat shock protein HtpX